MPNLSAVAALRCGRDRGRLDASDRAVTGPTALVLTRQALPQQPRTAAAAGNVRRGGYVLIDCQGTPECLVIAHRLRGRHRRAGGERAQCRAAGACGWCRCPRPRSSTPRTSAYRESVLPRGGARAGWRWRRARRGLVALRRQRAAASRHRSLRRLGQGARSVFNTFGFTAEMSQQDRFANSMEGMRRNDAEGRDQRLRAHRPQRAARTVRGRKRTDEMQIVAINDLGDAKTNAHLTRYDTVHGRFARRGARSTATRMVVNGDRIKVLAERDPAKLPWGDARRRDRARVHRPVHQQGQGRHAPEGRREAGRDLGAGRRGCRRHHRLRRQPQRAEGELTRSSPMPRAPPTAWRRWPRCCTTSVGIVAGVMTTIHSYTNDQVLTDVYHSDLRRARSATHVADPDQDRRRRGGRTGAAGAQGQARWLCDPRADHQCVAGRPHLHGQARHQVEEINKLMQGGGRRPAARASSPTTTRRWCRSTSTTIRTRRSSTPR